MICIQHNCRYVESIQQAFTRHLTFTIPGLSHCQPYRKRLEFCNTCSLNEVNRFKDSPRTAYRHIILCSQHSRAPVCERQISNVDWLIHPPGLKCPSQVLQKSSYQGSDFVRDKNFNVKRGFVLI